MLLEIEVENLQNTLTEVSKMRQYSVSLCLHPWKEVSYVPVCQLSKGIYLFK